MKFRRLTRFFVFVATSMAIALGLVLGGTMLLYYWHATRDLSTVVTETGAIQTIGPTQEHAMALAGLISEQLEIRVANESGSPDMAAILKSLLPDYDGDRISLYAADRTEIASTGAKLPGSGSPVFGNRSLASETPNFFTISVPMTGIGGWLVVDFEKHTDLGPLRRQTLSRQIDEGLFGGFMTLALGLGLIIALSALAAWAAARDVSRPLSAMGQWAESLGQGDFRTPLDVQRHDEIGRLADAMRQMRDTLRQTTISRDYLDRVLNSMTDVVLVTNTDGIIRHCNDGACRLLEADRDALMGKHIREAFAERVRSDFSMRILASGSGESWLLTSTGREIPVSYSSSAITSTEAQYQGYIMVARNISEQKRAENRIRYLARYDALTRVPNRMQFQHLMQHALSRCRRAGRRVALLYVDLDRFKDVNDSYGHLSGDRALETVAERMTAALPSETVVGRFGGDEFGVLLQELRDDDESLTYVGSVAKMILSEIARPLYFQEREIDLSASIGVALFPSDAENVIDLIRNADAAMHWVKKSGGHTFDFYRPDMNADSAEQLMLKAKLRRALERDEFTLRYQPKIDLNDGRIVGAEALVRWQLPGHGEISPAHFIPMAEESSLILAIGDWVLNKVCEDYQEWRTHVSHPGRIAVNLSLRQLRQRHLAQRVESIFKAHGVSPTSFEFEITESTIMEDPKMALAILDQLYGMGVHLSIDDFGTGYSSLSALQQFPINTLKIDQSFVQEAYLDMDDATIVSTIIQMGRSLRMDVVAEGVETEEQLNFLRKQHCHYVQGHLFGSPLRSEDFLALLRSETEDTARHRILTA